MSNFLQGKEKRRCTARGKLRFSNGFNSLASSSQLMFIVSPVSFLQKITSFLSDSSSACFDSRISSYLPCQKRVPQKSYFPFSPYSTNSPFVSSFSTKNMTKVFSHSATPSGCWPSNSQRICFFPKAAWRERQSSPSSRGHCFSMRKQSVLRLTVASKFTWFPNPPMDSWSICGSSASSLLSTSENSWQPPRGEHLVASWWWQLGPSSLLMRSSCSSRLRTRSLITRLRVRRSRRGFLLAGGRLEGAGRFIMFKQTMQRSQKQQKKRVEMGKTLDSAQSWQKQPFSDCGRALSPSNTCAGFPLASKQSIFSKIFEKTSRV